MWECPICFTEYDSIECPSAKEPWHINMVRQHEEIDTLKMNSPVRDKERNIEVKKRIWNIIGKLNPYAVENRRGNHIGRITVATLDKKVYRGDEITDEGEHFTIWWVDHCTGRIDNFAVLRYEDILSFQAGLMRVI